MIRPLESAVGQTRIDSKEARKTASGVKRRLSYSPPFRSTLFQLRLFLLGPLLPEKALLLWRCCALRRPCVAMAPSKMTSTLKSNAEANELTVRWGAFDVPGLDPKRAQAIGLEPAVKKIGYGSSSQELPPMLTHEGTIARYCRRTAELMLQTSEHWEQIELKTRDTNAYYKELLTKSRVQEEAYRTAADILRKIMARPGLLNVWELSCPGLLRSKQRELELQEPGTPVYLETLKEHTRIELVYDAVVALKQIENHRVIRESDIEERYAAVAARADEEQQKIMSQESQLAQELREIGDGTEHVVTYAIALESSLPSNVLTLREQRLLAVPPELFQLTHVEMLDLACNRIQVLPGEVCMMTKLKKLYLDSNRLTRLPHELHKLSNTLTLLGIADNPLDPELMQLYLAGLPLLLGHLKATRPSRSMSASTMNRTGSGDLSTFDIFTFDKGSAPTKETPSRPALPVYPGASTATATLRDLTKDLKPDPLGLMTATQVRS